ncbi:MAG: hypothetical protein DRP99_03205 [Candidatus Latescibacterota bacterium]|nr:MAG: hypothetical protein DRP99_03205 [Candidatus Latescibacterota bacterium]
MMVQGSRFRVRYALLALIVISVGRAYAQNPSHLRWKVMETEHFLIYYHQGLEDFARKAREVAEAIYGPVTELYDYRPDGKVHIVLRDDADYANGVSFFYDNKIEIWATGLDIELRGTTDWLWNVITHEFVHMVSLQLAMKYPKFVPAIYLQIFGYQPETRKDILVGYPYIQISYPLPGVTIPMWFAEGTAQYQARGARYDRWDSYRDMVLRVAVLRGGLLSWSEMGVFGKTSLGNEKVYDHGFALVRYIARRFGEGSLRRLFREMSKPWRVSFDGAVRKVLGVPAEELYRDWVGDMEKRYKEQLEGLGELVEGDTLFSGGYVNAFPRWSPDGKRLMFVSNRGQDYWITSLYIWRNGSKSPKLVAGGVSSPAGWTADGRILFVKRSPPDFHGSRFWDLYFYDEAKKKVRRLSRGLRVRYADLSPDGTKVAVVRNGGGRNKLELFGVKEDWKGLDSLRCLLSFPDRTELYTPRWSPDGRRIALSLAREGERDIAILDTTTGEVLYLASDGEDRDPAWTEDGKLVFSSDVSGIFNIYLVDLSSGEARRLTNVLGGAFHPSVSGDTLAFALYGKDGFGIMKLKGLRGKKVPEGTFKLHRGKAVVREPTPPKLDSSPYHERPLKLLVMPRLLWDEGEPKVGAFVTSSDVIGWHGFVGGGSLGWDGSRDGFIWYTYSRFPPTILLSLYNQVRHKGEAEVDSIYSIKSLGYDYDLKELFAGAVYNWRGKLLYGGMVLSRYDGRWQGQSLVSGERFGVRYTYFKGAELRLGCIYRKLPLARDMDINPRGGRAVSIHYSRSFHWLMKGFKVGTALWQEDYDRYFYDRITLAWDEFLALPWWRHSLVLRLQAGWITAKVDSFFYMPLGGWPGLRGYTRYSISGRKLVFLGATYRFPILRGINKSLGSFYLSNIYGGLFGEVGRAWDDDGMDLKIEGFKRDFGVQLRVDVSSFYGYPTALEFDVAYGLDEAEGRNPYKFYLRIAFSHWDDVVWLNPLERCGLW